MRINMVIQDDTGLLPIVVFRKVAEELTGISLVKMAAKEKVDRNVFPQGVIDLLDNKYRFQVGLTYKEIQNKTLDYKIFDAKQIKLTRSLNVPQQETQNQGKGSTHPLQHMQPISPAIPHQADQLNLE